MRPISKADVDALLARVGDRPEAARLRSAWAQCESARRWMFRASVDADREDDDNGLGEPEANLAEKRARLRRAFEAAQAACWEQT